MFFPDVGKARGFLSSPLAFSYLPQGRVKATRSSMEPDQTPETPKETEQQPSKKKRKLRYNNGAKDRKTIPYRR